MDQPLHLWALHAGVPLYSTQAQQAWQLHSPKLGEVVPDIALSGATHKLANKNAGPCISGSAAGVAAAQAVHRPVLSLWPGGRSRHRDGGAAWSQQVGQVPTTPPCPHVQTGSEPCTQAQTGSEPCTRAQTGSGPCTRLQTRSGPCMRVQTGSEPGAQAQTDLRLTRILEDPQPNCQQINVASLL